ncbi:MAG: hypothetical protein Q4D51_14800 [Eubacteriales bacterium]|nr:hypothetical protein [Eubacteriales bacterium]
MFCSDYRKKLRNRWVTCSNWEAKKLRIIRRIRTRICFAIAVTLVCLGNTVTNSSIKEIMAANNSDGFQSTMVNPPSEINGYTGIWLTEPIGQEDYPIQAGGLWIKEISGDRIEFQTAFFEGTPTEGNHAGNYEWSILRETSGTSEISISDIEGLRCFVADDETIYLSSDHEVYLGKYKESLRMTKTNFSSFDECVTYYNIDYGYCYNKKGGATLAKHGINLDYLSDELWYNRYRRYSNDRVLFLDVAYSRIWEDGYGMTIAIQPYYSEESRGAIMFFPIHYDVKGENGELIYYSLDSHMEEYAYMLTYYPDDHHIFINTENDQVYGEYYAEDAYDIAATDQSQPQAEIQDSEYSFDSITEPDEYDNSTAATDTSITTDNDDSNIWFVYYNQFQKLGGSESLGVFPMTDALMSVHWMSGMDSVEWQFGLEPAEIGSDGQMIYYYGKDIVMSYHPDDHHISIQSSDENFNGEYICLFDFNGGWADSNSGRCYMEITSQNDRYYEIMIDWASSSSENTHWEFLAEYDTNQGCLVYQDGQRTEQYFPDGGGAMQKNVVYTDGTGSIYAENGKLYWKDEKENAGNNCVFER